MSDRRGIVFDIQSYAIYDGPGIRTCVYFKGCPLRCWWCHNPESQRLNPEMAYWEEKCVRCGICIETCPNKALELSGERVVRDARLCTACGACAEACPNGAMEKIGREITGGQIREKVGRDKIFYDNSAGGVTISGGEPTFQKDFLLDVLGSLEDAGIHIAIETCGYFSSDLIKPLLDKVNLFLYDIKHLNTEAHEKGTGKSNESILENFSKVLSKAGRERIIPRIPLIPGFNTSPESISDFVSFLKKSGYCGPVHLLPYHRWAKGKYEGLGRGDEFRNPGNIKEDELEEISLKFFNAGFEPLMHG